MLTNKKIEAALAEHTRRKHLWVAACERVEAADTALFDAEDAREIIQTAAATVQNYTSDRIAAVVCTCLDHVFGEGAYRFNLRFDMARNRTEAVLELWEGDIRLNPTESTAGGVLDVASFGLRCAALMLGNRPPRRRLVVLDEPFKWVSVEFRSGIPDMLEYLAEELDIQFIAVTHMPEITCGTVHQL